MNTSHVSCVWSVSWARMVAASSALLVDLPSTDHRTVMWIVWLWLNQRRTCLAERYVSGGIWSCSQIAPTSYFENESLVTLGSSLEITTSTQSGADFLIRVTYFFLRIMIFVLAGTRPLRLEALATLKWAPGALTATFFDLFCANRFRIIQFELLCYSFHLKVTHKNATQLEKNM